MTKDYYNKNAKEYIKNTANLDMRFVYKEFLKTVAHGGKILDIGFGSGRDSLYFEQNYEVISIDNSISFVNEGKKKLKGEVLLLDSRDINYDSVFDGIFASASLLHLKKSELKNVFNACYKALKPSSTMYVSFKEGNFEGEVAGRYFTYLTSEVFASIIKDTGFYIRNIFYSFDKRDNNNDKWMNIFLSK